MSAAPGISLTPASTATEVALEYFRRLDAGDPTLMDLYDPDVTFYFPKFGVGRGRAQLGEVGGALGQVVAAMAHDMSTATFVAAGDRVVVEGVSRGQLRDGRSWSGGETPAGRYCNVFEVKGGKIVRLFIYLDPDYGGDDEGRFLWGRDGRAW